MPKKPLKRLVRGNANSLPIGALEQILLGFDPFFYKPLPESRIKQLYLKNKAFIMGLIGQNLRKTIPGWFVRGIPIGFGTRPAAWWSYDATEGRRMIAGDPDEIWPNSPLWLGIPKLYTRPDHSCRFETQAAYLERLDLLLPGELEKIKPESERI